jgi:NAD-dependent deacetylase
MLENKNQNIKALIESSNYPVFFTGNSLSSLSGVPSFNEKIFGHRIMEILDANFYIKNRDIFNKALKHIFQWTKLNPSHIHKSIADFGFPTITEAIDGLHQRAGNSNVIELHGNLHSLLCKDCKKYTLKESDEHSFKSKSCYCPVCNKSSSTDIVLSGETINNFHIAVNEIYKADLLIILGSDLSQWPANKIVLKAYKSGCTVLNFPLINNSVSSIF